VLDPIEVFIREEDRNPGEPIFFDYLHLTPKGNRLLGEMIAGELIGKIF